MWPTGFLFCEPLSLLTSDTIFAKNMHIRENKERLVYVNEINPEVEQIKHLKFIL